MNLCFIFQRCLCRAGLWGAILLATASGQAREILTARVEGVIGPVSARFMVQTIEQAEAKKAECVIFELDTPGGLDDSMRQIIKKIMASQVPVVIYVAPSGSRAASAGAFITLSAHVAAMAPGTAIGAAHPVALAPSSAVADSNVIAKAENDAAALFRSIAAQRGRNVDWANAAVKESVSLSEQEASQQKVIDFIAADFPALLQEINGREIMMGTQTVVINTDNALLTKVTMNWRDEALSIIANPNVAYLLFMLGLLGLYFELSTPGAVLPGVVGAISLLLALFAFQTLPISITGIMLIILAVVLFIVEVKAATHGVLAVGGIVAMFIGSIMLFDSPDPALHASMDVIIPVVLATALFFVIGIWLSIRSMIRRPTSGHQALIDEEGDARTLVDQQGGRVFVAGAHWSARAESLIPPGTRIKVNRVVGMTLIVSPTDPRP